MPKKNNPLLIAITGGIASGKSSFSKLIEEKGYNVFYTDKIGHNVLELDSTKKEIMEKIGREVFSNNKIDRKKLREIVFNDKKKLELLNQITHKKIREKINSIILESEEEVIFFEIPLLIESNLQNFFHFNILISLEEKIRIERLTKRNNISKKQALKIINSQLNDKIKKKYVDLIIDNSLSPEYLKSQTDIFFQMLKFIPKKKLKPLS
jgi:dephospho-CoA kinase